MILCHICQGRFLVTSLPRHMATCKAKHEKNMSAALPPSLCVPIATVDCPLPELHDPPERFDAYNMAAEVAHKASVPRCPGCEEAFLPDKLLKHMRKCCLGRFESTAAAIGVFMSQYEGDANVEGDPMSRLETKSPVGLAGGSITPKGLKGKSSTPSPSRSPTKKSSPGSKKGRRSSLSKPSNRRSSISEKLNDIQSM